MPREKLQTKSIQILTAVVSAKSGISGIGVVAPTVSSDRIRSIHEQDSGSSDYLHFKAVLRALQLGKILNSRNISVLCPDEKTVRVVNREEPLELGSPLVPLYIKIRALIYTYGTAEVLAVPKSRIGPARRLAVSAMRDAMNKIEESELGSEIVRH